MIRRRTLRFAPPAEWLTVQVCAMALIVLMAGAICDCVAFFLYEVVKMKGLQ